jgi:hypothetical protein
MPVASCAAILTLLLVHCYSTAAFECREQQVTCHHQQCYQLTCSTGMWDLL